MNSFDVFVIKGFTVAIFKISESLKNNTLIFTIFSRMDLANKDDFTFFMRRALTSSDDDCYIELYNLLLRFEFIYVQWNTDTWTRKTTARLGIWTYKNINCAVYTSPLRLIIEFLRHN